MKKTTIALALLLPVAFFTGQYFSGPAMQAPSLTADVSFSGGAAASANAKKSVIDHGAVGQVHQVKPGQLIMDAVKAAQPGDVIQVFPGDYVETVYIDKDNIRLSGVIIDGKRPRLYGEERLNDAILYSGNNILIENFLITKYKGNGIMGQAGNNFEIRHNIIEDTGVYGIFPQLGINGLVEHNVISGIEDAAIYVGMSDHIHVANNEVFDSVAGIEIENSRHAVVENNFVHNNTGGILAFVTPGLPIKDTVDVIIRNNWISNNNTANFGAPGSMVAGIPAGTGILIMAADEVIIEDNIIIGNKTAGIIITDHQNAPNTTLDPESDPTPDKVMILNNLMYNNGYDTIAEAKVLLATEFKQGQPDIIRVGNSNGSCINNPQQYITVGVSKWPACSFTNTDSVVNYLLEEPAAPRTVAADEKGKYVYLGVCTGCHAYTGRLIGPPVQVIQSLYMDEPQALADYILNPMKKRDDYPAMPKQDYLDAETRLAVAEYMLKVGN
ncbi:MAG: right-handed parallel beta-helix repeat-containing protein [Gammaproteobacteria bacterium]|nr:right-handed parallel beta-helix repeat-containing protein [Gammaproteobacteria bacterium]MBU1557255.1 right-handed parallel beta-helix repeat-containing protein [Gammaproteobacteria bacterium]MBU2069952.1 right-handed parallel beta-helix repeat-containing protein [Gammaproteobacteria bacterium]MBU2185097.1 right-handed parallel beta-helix repeat-containing protein [Gammaproteobacteria bacterium]MBU2206965.1 right-handed parallel beta-helix repeat-containing protein [Gammaproteobacteria bact